MLSIDTNLLFYAINKDSPYHQAALQFITKTASRDDVVICELVLAELYLLLRNPAALPKSLNNSAACTVIDSYRRHPHWQIVGFPPESKPLHDALWKEIASTPDFAQRRLFDLRIALVLQSFGVKEFATANTKDFHNLGFEKVWNPLVMT